MINLDRRYESYLHGNKKLRINGEEHQVKAYGYTDDGKSIDVYYLTTDNHQLYYNNEAQFLRMEPLKGVSQPIDQPTLVDV